MIWTEAQAERQLRSLELFGMRFGLDRMRRMMTALGSPERRFDAIHVLGTNGKSSTTRMTAAILERHGLRTGAYLSPHLVSYRERVLIDGRELDADAFAAAVARASWAAERVNRTLAEDDHVTQFELLTAAALWEMARQQVDVAVVEAGLGGRYDATSVIDSRVTVLTNVGLEHTRWLGPTVTDIAEEKLAVVRPRTALVLGEGLAAPALAVAERVARERGARIVRPRAAGGSRPSCWRAAPSSGATSRSRAPPPRPTCRLPAIPAGRGRRSLAPAACTDVPGRLQLVDEDPPTVLDGAHNPDAVAALVESLPDAARPGADRAGARRARGQGCGRDARRADAGRAARLVHRAAEQPRALAGGAAVARAPARLRADRVRAEAGAGAGAGAALGAYPGGHPPWRGTGRRARRRRAGDRIGVSGRRSAGPARARRSRARGAGRSGEPRRMNDQGPSVLTMIGAVALFVALVILVFFAAGYGFGRLFL